MKAGDEFCFGLSAEFGYAKSVVAKVVHAYPGYAIVVLPPGFDPTMVGFGMRVLSDGCLRLECDTDFLFPAEWAREEREEREFRYINSVTGETVVVNTLHRAGAPR